MNVKNRIYSLAIQVHINITCILENITVTQLTRGHQL